MTGNIKDSIHEIIIHEIEIIWQEKDLQVCFQEIWFSDYGKCSTWK